MPRVIGIDPGTVTIDVCGLDAGQVFLDRSLPTSEALTQPTALVELLNAAAPLDLVAGPSGYGLPLTAARDLTETDLRLAYLAAEKESGGIGGIRSLMRVLAASSIPVVLTPGVVHLTSVPAHRKVNRVDMGTADKVCAVALAIRDQAHRRRCDVRDASFILLELGGAFTAAISVEAGRIVDGVGGTSGPLGVRASERSRFLPVRSPRASCLAVEPQRSPASQTRRLRRSLRRTRHRVALRGKRIWKAP
jgi:predicted butyrate kinase (DUF1464 family)